MNRIKYNNFKFLEDSFLGNDLSLLNIINDLEEAIIQKKSFDELCYKVINLCPYVIETIYKKLLNSDSIEEDSDIPLDSQIKTIVERYCSKREARISFYTCKSIRNNLAHPSNNLHGNLYKNDIIDIITFLKHTYVILK